MKNNEKIKDCYRGPPRRRETITHSYEVYRPVDDYKPPLDVSTDQLPQRWNRIIINTHLHTPTIYISSFVIK